MLCLLDAVLAVVHAVVHAVVDAIAYPVLSAYMLFLCSVRMARKSDGPERHVARQHVARQHCVPCCAPVRVAQSVRVASLPGVRI